MTSSIPELTEALGMQGQFANWARGSGSAVKIPPPTSTGNSFAALENIGDDRRVPPLARALDSAETADMRTSEGIRSSSRDPSYSSKGPSLERYGGQSYDRSGGGSRTGSQHRSQDRNSSQQRNIPPPMQSVTFALPGKPAPVPFAPAPAPTPVAPAPKIPELSEEALESKLNTMLQEYLSDFVTVAECAKEIVTCIPLANRTQIVSIWCEKVIDGAQNTRIGAGRLCAGLLKEGAISPTDYLKSMEDIFTMADDYAIDIPQIWDFLPDLFVPLLKEDAISLKALHSAWQAILDQGHGKKFLRGMVRHPILKENPQVLQNHWRESGLNLTMFMKAEEVSSFVEENAVEFLVDNSPVLPQSSRQISWDEVKNTLLEFFKKNAPFDDVTHWISSNVGDRAKSNEFIRACATAVFENSIVVPNSSSTPKLQPEVLLSHSNVFSYYVDGNAQYELQCLFALQALVRNLQHPQGLLLSFFETLYHNTLISHESFIAWEDNKDPLEQGEKGVAVLQLVSFFTNLKEADSSDGSD